MSSLASPWPPIRRALGGALALAFPVECAGCGALDVALCDDCRALMRATARARTLPGGLVVRSGLVFDDAVARAIRALKEEGRTALARPLAPALAVSLSAFDVPAETTIVPIPTSRAAMRRRGYRVVELIARRAGIRTTPLLAIARTTADQRLLGREERQHNVAGSMRARESRGLPVVVIDDVVTTGATLAEAARALERAGAIVLGAATVASTARRRQR